jgi:hypothetical protein
VLPENGRFPSPGKRKQNAGQRQYLSIFPFGKQLSRQYSIFLQLYQRGRITADKKLLASSGSFAFVIRNAFNQ